MEENSCTNSQLLPDIHVVKPSFKEKKCFSKRILFGGICAITIVIGFVVYKTLYTNRYPLRWQAGVFSFRVISVIASNSSADQLYDRYFIISQFHKSFVNTEMACCILHQDGVVIKTRYKVTGRTKKESRVYTDRYFNCLNYWPHKAVGATLAFLKDKCPTTHDAYVTPYFTEKKDHGSFAVYAHLAYGTLDPELVIEWMEAHKYLGVTKVMISIDDALNRKALAVLQYYVSTGFLEMVSIEPGNVRDKDTKQHIGRGSTFILDFAERYRGYTYQAVVDLDEFIVPVHEDNLQDMMANLMARYSGKFVFRLMTSFHLLSFPKEKDGDLIVHTYPIRTEPPILQAPKFIVHTDSMDAGAHQLPIVSSMSNRYKVDLKVNEIYIHHFRQCRTSGPLELFYKLCTDRSIRTKDTVMKKLNAAILGRVKRTRLNIFGDKRIHIDIEL